VSDNKDTVFSVVLSFLLLPLLYIYHGWILTLFWKWFVVSAFHIPALSITQAIGISLTMHLLVPTPTKPNEQSAIVGMMIAFAVGTLMLLIGAIVHAFM
jgi:hypothetical protein